MSPDPSAAASDRATAVVAVDVAVLTVRSGRLHALLVPRDDAPQAGRWQLPGHDKPADATLRACAGAELEERLGVPLEGGHLEQLGSYGDPGRDPRGHVVSVTYLALVPEIRISSDRRGVARFWSVEDLGAGYGPPLAFDHDVILGDAVERARAKLEYTTLATRLVPDPFTIGELYDVYRAVWGVEPGDRANFSRKVKRTDGFVVQTERSAERIGRGRPSVLYTAGPATDLHPPILRPGRPPA